jgi:hypothetical protein
MKGHYCELLVYSGTLSAGNITSIETYLAGKWGITLA